MYTENSTVHLSNRTDLENHDGLYFGENLTLLKNTAGTSIRDSEFNNFDEDRSCKNFENGPKYGLYIVSQ